MSILYVGLMSGTSADGIDAALIEVTDAGIAQRDALATPYPAELKQRVLALADGTTGLDAAGGLDVELGHLFAQAVTALLEKAGARPKDVRAIGSHGQTVRHRPDADPPFTLQIGDANVIASSTGITTVADFRRRDVALGGQGAPLVPAFHNTVFASADEDRVVVNIGGIANVTLLPAGGAVSGFDTGPGNVLLDTWVKEQTGLELDDGGALAAQGTVDTELLEQMLADRYFLARPPKSTGREYFNSAWIQALIRQHGDLPSARDMQATLTELTARSISDAVSAHLPTAMRLLACGGGCHNAFLMQRIAALMPDREIETTAGHGIDPDWVEAVAFAWLAHARLENIPGNVPAVTGARETAVLGAVYAA